MPNYEYTCLNCDETFDRMSKIDDRDTQKCHKCGYRLNRNVAFNGTVWSPTSTGGGHK